MGCDGGDDEDGAPLINGKNESDTEQFIWYISYPLFVEQFISIT